MTEVTEEHLKMLWCAVICERLERQGIPKMNAQAQAMSLVPFVLPQYEHQVHPVLAQVDSIAQQYAPPTAP
jgi:hypothetical protein